MIPSEKTAALPGGLRLPYVESGDPTGTPVLLLHGFTDSAQSFARLLPLLPLLPPGLRAIALTQRGHGDASRPEAGYAMADFAADAAALLDLLGMSRAVILGHSMGCAVALRFALDHPRRTRGLVLMGGLASPGASPGVRALREEVEGLTDPVGPAFVEGFQRSAIARPVPEPFFQAALAQSRKLPARIWRAALDGLIEAEALPDLAPIAVPTLVIHGGSDAFVAPEDQAALAAAIPGARRVVYPGVGHSPHWEVPDAVAADLAGFAAGLPAAAKRRAAAA